MISGINAGSIMNDYMTTARENKVNNVSETQGIFSKYIKGENANFPYSSLAKDGVIEYNGVVFVGDSKSNSLCLGDMSNKNRVMHIQLSGGGMLKVNYDNVGDLKEAIGMFSGRDQGIILKAISTYHFEKGFVKAAEDEEEEAVEEMSQQDGTENNISKDSGLETEAEIAMEVMAGRRLEDIIEK